MSGQLPSLPLASWQETRDTLAAYAKILCTIRGALSPPEKHWGHENMRTTATGLTTTPIPAGAGAEVDSFEMALDFAAHAVHIRTNRGDTVQISLLRGLSPQQFHDAVMQALQRDRIAVEVDTAPFQKLAGVYDGRAVQRFWQALSRIDLVFRAFRAGLREEASPVQFWPDHFDLAMLWFSGRRVPDTDPEDPEYADEQMNFGFASGDELITAPYFYITAYPLPEALRKIALPEHALWHREGWEGAVLMYETLLQAHDPAASLLKFLRTVQQAGAQLMR